VKYKNIDNAIHNLGHSFMSGINWVDGAHIKDDINELARKESDGVWINFSTGEIKPAAANTRRIKLSVAGYQASLGDFLLRHNVNPAALSDVTLHYRRTTQGGQLVMLAVDDRGVEHKMLVKRPN
jgi:hypothetical protein